MDRVSEVRQASWLVAAPLLLGGCDFFTSLGPSSCDRSASSNEPVRYTEGTVDNGTYQSSPPDGEQLYVPGGMRYRIEHKLGTEPISWDLYLSFSQYGTADGGTLAAAAGNQAEVVEVDANHLVVVNGSCSTYWLRVVAEAD